MQKIAEQSENHFSEVVSATTQSPSQTPSQVPQQGKLSHRELTFQETMDFLKARETSEVIIEHECPNCKRTHNHRIKKDGTTNIEKLFLLYYKKGQSDSCGKPCYITKELRELQSKTVELVPTTSS